MITNPPSSALKSKGHKDNNQEKHIMTLIY